jgi:hypothetical protein
MPTGFEHLWGTALTAAFVLFLIYRRFRRTFGRQPLRPKRMIVRMTVLGVIGLLLLPAALRSADSALAIGVGLAVGLGLGMWGAKHTRFERHQQELHYIPHTYAGMVVAALFLGRLIYRFVMLGQGGLSSPGALGPIYQNPVTLSVFFVLIGYYVYYYGFVLWKSKHITPEDLEVASTES